MTGSIDHGAWASRKSYFRLPDGRSLAYVDTGGTTAALIFIHGYSDSSRSFSLMEPFLRNFRLVIPDLPGHGVSDARDRWTVEGLASDIAALIDSLDSVPVAVIGHSLGAMIAIKLASMDRPPMKTLVTIAGTVRPALLADASLCARILDLSDPIDPRDPFFEYWHACPQPVNQGFLDHLRGEAAAIPASVWHGIFFELCDLDLSFEAARINIPSLGISGGQDELFDGKHRTALNNTVSDSQSIVMDGHGHNPHWENPELVAAHIRRFLAV
ncbi:alpha/beta fold hydrolase [Rhizobium sp. HT1-10]|uniref:alpha/beta fold hydrolase n=1 Tax=Rhizobium sp. HT1-10 TaxID=3111638 RepID=UPI003C13589B